MAKLNVPAWGTNPAGNGTDVDNLQKGDVLLCRVRKINFARGQAPSDPRFKIQLEFAEYVENESRPSDSPLAILNIGDERFSANRPRRGWLAGELKGIIDAFGLDSKALSALEISTGMSSDEQIEGTHFYNLSILNPTLGGRKLRLEVIESLEQTSPEQEAKLNPTTKEFVLHKGEKIYTNVNVVYEPKHQFLMSDTLAKATGRSNTAVAVPVYDAMAGLTQGEGQA